jgi:hypothetical protein
MESGPFLEDPILLSIAIPEEKVRLHKQGKWVFEILLSSSPRGRKDRSTKMAALLDVPDVGQLVNSCGKASFTYLLSPMKRLK